MNFAMATLGLKEMGEFRLEGREKSLSSWLSQFSKTLRGPVVIGGDNLPSPVRIGLTDLQNIGGASGPPGSPISGTTAM